eukprot:1734898-Rhodomonas_salina.2
MQRSTCCIGERAVTSTRASHEKQKGLNTSAHPIPPERLSALPQPQTQRCLIRSPPVPSALALLQPSRPC